MLDASPVLDMIIKFYTLKETQKARFFQLCEAVYL